MKPNKSPDSNFADWDATLPKTHNRVVAFEAQQKLKQDANTLRTKTGTGKKTKATNTENPYLRARIKILTDYPEWRRNEIAEMERTGDINNKFYDAFVHEVAILGDTYMPIG